MLLPERHAAILERLATNGRVVAFELAQTFEVSEDTVRRDLRGLARAGLCRRIYGGALPPAPAVEPLSVREAGMTAAQRRLAEAAVKLVEPGKVLFIDAGSTNTAIAAALPTDFVLTVATNAPSVAHALAGHANVSVILVGGGWDRDKGACLGAAAVEQGSRIHANICFLGACGVNAEAGITALSFEEAAFKRVIVHAARSVTVAATSEKLGTVGPFDVAPSALVTHLIVTRDIDPAELVPFREQGIRVSFA
jgi:DeoR/GlpR family transcriptional regulator of sugar metabolism